MHRQSSPANENSPVEVAIKQDEGSTIQLIRDTGSVVLTKPEETSSLWNIVIGNVLGILFGGERQLLSPSVGEVPTES